MYCCGNSFYRYMNNPFMGGCFCNNNNFFGNMMMFSMFSNMMNNIFAMQPQQMFMPQFAMPMPQAYPMQSVFSYAQPYRMPQMQPLFNFQQPAYNNYNIFNTFNTIINKTESPRKNKTTAAYFANSSNSGEIASNDMSKYGVSEKTMPNGTKVLACRWSKFDKCQPEWIEQQKYLLQAANEHGFTILYGDVTRTVAESNAGRAKKGSLVCKGGESPHNYGVAVDIVCYKNGKAVSVDSAEYASFARRAVELSGNKIEWGGEWRKKGERHHFNMRNWKNTYKRSEHLVG